MFPDGANDTQSESSNALLLEGRQSQTALDTRCSSSMRPGAFRRCQPSLDRVVEVLPCALAYRGISRHA
eukprot:CAMPEP_0168500442 /NCGR_PEP_ID=MMETSP0228-20121227/74290_1 /TAXON_ID=133427 /ORGANISM="Protoceratium reticulatum, Strain CCCM 535 (=CCMP 1889)" /LENGTH=68 /DNA_ID=CAMNT_0008517363 /DNA_START=30 /DNA_END=233 /DNA_ORIENTATION=-